MGTNFSGSQIQKNNRTVQGELVNAISTLTGITKVIMSGRTDKGVSAKCQCAHFDSPHLIENENKFLHSLNAILPFDIRVFSIENVVASFHAQKSATYRHYQYKINNSRFKKSVFDNNVLYSRLALDTEKSRNALHFLLGEHDFSSFKSVSGNPARVCTIYYADIFKDTEYVLIDIVGNRFLYNMVRAIVGTLFLIENKNLPADYMDWVLKSKNRANAGANSKPEGLTLIKTGYDNPIDYVIKLDERH
ncbi:MAG: tRNA pseudouridine(38-40) synthase TruA [Candidatus Gastranaerophilales bacterium]|nr:tRNA pseudouridine(38-40) synthase TruA [Candidatus Gastranaerophilales bacterium]